MIRGDLWMVYFMSSLMHVANDFITIGVENNAPTRYPTGAIDKPYIINLHNIFSGV